MARTTGSKNQIQPKPPHTVELSTEGKIEFLATLIVERITEDLADGQKILTTIEGHYAAELRTSA
jgi:hypothetical protein